ncbi:LLM class F420-dependent oxidoreductase [Rhodococcus sp. IEGM 248]|uniref:LLM class F420-dependent oxidoreductase n=1 Tax=Rhodococcus opacus TaxID=37919 RepID=UPI0013C12579|nr:LLM class F420-dependent oxidoreductase [Rhodococcus opacus]MDV7082877.1 LLM class F420-dependent oxidoreductase [Rhodococcus opacus]NDV03027.1 LLM class F420-dependent oxidoreductase [Rhodococcus sp. IEGM 248]
MTRIEGLGPIGISLNISPDETYLGEAARLESLGYSAIWLRGGQIDSLDRISAVIRATDSIPVATGIIPVGVYDSGAVAQLHADLQTTAPDRFVVGLGGPQVPRPLRALNEYLDRLDRFDPPVPAERRILAALGPRKLELARDRAAGAVLLLVTPDYTAEARRILGPDATLVVSLMTVLGTDAAQARDTARVPLRFLSGVGGYATNFARMGFGADDIAGLSDRLVDDLVAWGDADAIVARVHSHLAAGADHVVVSELGERPDEAARQLARLLPLRA